MLIINDRKKKIKSLAEKSWEYMNSNRKVLNLLILVYSFTRLPWSLKNIETIF